MGSDTVPMLPSRVIEAKRDGASITPQDLEAFLLGYLANEVPEYQMAAFLMAAHFRGMDPQETDVLVDGLLGSGATLDLSHLDGPRVDKHSTGGVGDKVSLVLAPLAAELGLYVPMMAGRGLGHTTGTVDKLEAIPGFRTQLSLKELVQVLSRTGCAMIGQTDEIAPLDRRLYALRDVTATVPIVPVIAASIMSKKLAEGLTGLVLDVKVGAGAFIPEEDRARELARTMVGIGLRRGLPTVALLTAMDRPLGWAVGNGLETREAIVCLRGEGPEDLTRLVLHEVAELLVLAGLENDWTEARRNAAHALAQGRALERFRSLVEAQGGDPRVLDEPTLLRTAAEVSEVVADRAGKVQSIDPRALGEGVVALGGGRRRLGDTIDRGVGFELAVEIGTEVGRGDRLGTVHAKDAEGLEAGARILADAVDLGDGGEPPRPLVSHRVSAEGVEELE
jgi:pyrimidine-nucleoside phosphorylase